MANLKHLVICAFVLLLLLSSFLYAQDSQPLDLRAEAAEPPPSREHTTVAEDMLLAAKSVFHAVLPNSSAK